MTTQSDEIIMQQVAKGNLDGMTILFDRYHKWIYNFLYKMQPDQALCEDLTQNVFYKAIRYRNSYSGGKFSSWIFKITRNIFSDHIEKQKKISNVAIDHLVIVDEDGKEDLSEELIRLRLVLNRLPLADKELIVLSKYQGLRYKEIADIIGSNETAVKTRIHRILRKMRTLYFEKKAG